MIATVHKHKFYQPIITCTYHTMICDMTTYNYLISVHFLELKKNLFYLLLEVNAFMVEIVCVNKSHDKLRLFLSSPPDNFHSH